MISSYVLLSQFDGSVAGCLNRIEKGPADAALFQPAQAGNGSPSRGSHLLFEHGGMLTAFLQQNYAAFHRL
jgi:hypothetical protein